MKNCLKLRKFSQMAIIFMMIGGLLSGCVDEIDFNIDREGGTLVVSGGIYDHKGPFIVKLALTDEINTVPVPVSGAEVMLIDHRDTRFRYLETEPGNYVIPVETVDVRRGDSFHIEIKLPDGRIYRSIPETVPLFNGFSETILEVGFIQEPSATGRLLDVPAISILANTTIPDPSETLFLKWDVESVYTFVENEPASPAAPPPNICYVTRKTATQSINLIRSDELGSKTIENQPLAVKRIIRDQFYIRHLFIVTVSSISERRYLYWKNVDEMINQSGTIFDSPPATVKGNIVNINDENDFALGYFEAAARNRSYDFVTRADLPVFIPNPCSGAGRGPAECDNCLLIDDSSLDRPDIYD